MKNNFLVYLCATGLWIILLSCTVVLTIGFNGTITVMDGKVTKMQHLHSEMRHQGDETPRLFLSKLLNIQHLATIRFWPKSSAGKFVKELKRASGIQPKPLVSISSEAAFLILIFNAYFSFLAWYPRVQHRCVSHQGEKYLT